MYKPDLRCVRSVTLTTKLVRLQENRRDYRELFVTADFGKNIAGIILYKETLAQSSAGGTPFVQCLRDHNVLPGIKVDEVRCVHCLCAGPADTSLKSPFKSTANEVLH